MEEANGGKLCILSSSYICAYMVYAIPVVIQSARLSCKRQVCGSGEGELTWQICMLLFNGVFHF